MYPSDLVRQLTDLPTYRELSRSHAEDIPVTHHDFQDYTREQNEICRRSISALEVADYLEQSGDTSVDYVVCRKTSSFFDSKFMKIDKKDGAYFVSHVYFTSRSTDRDTYNAKCGKEERPIFDVQLVLLATENSSLLPQYQYHMFEKVKVLYDAVTSYNIRRQRGCSKDRAIIYTVRDYMDNADWFIANTEMLFFLGTSEFKLRKLLYHDDCLKMAIGPPKIVYYKGKLTINRQPTIQVDRFDNALGVNFQMLSDAADRVEDLLYKL